MGSPGHVEVAHVSHVLPDGRTLLDDVSFRIGEGITAALVGPNGAGKTTLLRLIAGDIQPQAGTVTATGGLGVMRQFIGETGVAPLAGTAQDHDEGAGSNGATAPMVRDLLLSVSPPRVREAAARCSAPTGRGSRVSSGCWRESRCRTREWPGWAVSGRGPALGSGPRAVSTPPR